MEELADNLEILEALGNKFGFSLEDILKIKQEKKKKGDDLKSDIF